MSSATASLGRPGTPASPAVRTPAAPAGETPETSADEFTSRIISDLRGYYSCCGAPWYNRFCELPGSEESSLPPMAFKVLKEDGQHEDGEYIVIKEGIAQHVKIQNRAIISSSFIELPESSCLGRLKNSYSKFCRSSGSGSGGGSDCNLSGCDGGGEACVLCFCCIAVGITLALIIAPIYNKCKNDCATMGKIDEAIKLYKQIRPSLESATAQAPAQQTMGPQVVNAEVIGHAYRNEWNPDLTSPRPRQVQGIALPDIPITLDDGQTVQATPTVLPEGGIGYRIPIRLSDGRIEYAILPVAAIR